MGESIRRHHILGVSLAAQQTVIGLPDYCANTVGWIP
jgi:hypothetical protein